MLSIIGIIGVFALLCVTMYGVVQCLYFGLTGEVL